MEFDYLLDSSFDSAFAGRPSLRWWPWVGSKFTESVPRTMLVGESVYDWGEGFKERYKQADGLRQTHLRHALNYRRESVYVRNIERAIYNASRPSVDRKRQLWSAVAYHNLVLEPLRSIKHRPTYAQYLEGWREFFELSRVMAIDQAIVYGVEAKKIGALVEAIRLRQATLEQNRPLTKVGRSVPRLITIADDGRPLKLLFIRHPSAFFSWRLWGPVIHQHLSLELTLGR